MGDPPAAYPVVVLAGGLGTRMAQFAPDLPKALVPVLGEPFAFHQLRLLASQGVRDVVYVIGHLGPQIRAAVDDGAAFGLAVTYVEEGESQRGTGGALRFAHDLGALPDVFGVLYGDSYLPIDLEPIWQAFNASERPALMTVLLNDDLWDRSNAVFEGGRVTAYDKRLDGRTSQMRWIDYGFSVVDRDVVETMTPGRADLADVFRELSAQGNLAGYEVTERFYEVGSPEGVTELERFLAGVS